MYTLHHFGSLVGYIRFQGANTHAITMAQQGGVACAGLVISEREREEF